MLEEKISNTKEDMKNVISVLQELNEAMKNLEILINKATTSASVFELINKMSNANSEKIENALERLAAKADLQKCQQLILSIGN